MLPFFLLMYITCISLWALSGYSAGVSIGSVGWFPYLAHSASTLVAMIVLTIISLRYTEKIESNEKNFLALIAISMGLSALGNGPWLDDDIYRYMWDGFASNQGWNPILNSPDQGPLTFDQTTFSRIAYKDIPSVYPPMAQQVFKHAYRWFGVEIRLWTGLTALIAVATIMFLKSCVTEKKISKWPLCILALHPVFLKESADSGHVDVFAILFLAASMWVLRESSRGFVRLLLSGSLIGLAASFKLHAIIVLPFIGTWCLRGKMIQLTAAILTMSLTFLMQYESWQDVLYYWQVVRYFGDNWLFNPLVVNVFQAILPRDFPIFGPWAMSRALGLSLAVSVYLYYLFRSMRCDVRERSRYGLRAVGFFLICQPVVNPWYFLILWPLMADLDVKNRSQKIELIFWCWLATWVSLSNYIFWVQNMDMSLIRLTLWILFVTVCLTLKVNLKRFVSV